MSGDSDLDLTGRWTGIYNYPEIAPPNSLEATLRDVGGLITCLTSERDDDPYGRGSMLHAVIEGCREGCSVTLKKFYDELEPEPVVIVYSGTIHSGGDEIRGRWDRADMWSGTFIMIRSPGAEEENTLAAAESVPAGLDR